VGEWEGKERKDGRKGWMDGREEGKKRKIGFSRFTLHVSHFTFHVSHYEEVLNARN
jgi:hypothetical protein